MRSRLGAALLGLTAVAGVVCGPVPADPETGGPTGPATVGPALPVRTAAPLDWRIIPLPPGTFEARVDRQSITALRVDQAAAGDDEWDEVLVQRRADGQRLAGHRFKPTYRPVHWLVHHDSLVLVEQQRPGDMTYGLTVVDLATGAGRQLPLRAVRQVTLADPVVMGEEILVVGWPATPGEACVLALRRPAYTERTVECGLSNRLSGLVPGHDGVLWTRDCRQWRQLQADGTIRSRPAQAEICDFDSTYPVAVLAGRQLNLVHQGTDRMRALVATNPPRTLGEVTATAMLCGEHVYWAGGGDTAEVLMRWRPGADHTETVLHARPDTTIQKPQCVAGVLNVGLGPNAHRVPLREFHVLDHP